MTPSRLAVVAAGGVLAAVAMAGCAPQTDYGQSAGDQPALVNATGEASATPSGSANTSAPPAAAGPVDLTTALVGKTLDRMGKAVTNDEGFLLYRFEKDTANPPKSNCNGTCAKIWPPALTDGNPELTGIDASKVGTVVREDGTRQITIGGWPIYYYAGDTKAGQWKGQGVGGTWFVVQPDGKKNLSCLPTGTPTPIPVPTETGGSGGGTSGGGDTSGGYTY